MEVAEDRRSEPNPSASANPGDAEHGLPIGGSMNGSDQFTLPALPTDSVVDSSSTAAQLGYRGADGGEEAAVGSGSPRGENPGKETAGEIREGSAGSSPGSSTGESGDGTATGSRNGEETALGGGNRSPTAGDPSKADSGDGGMVAEGPGSWRPGANGLELYDAEVPAAESCAPCNGEDLGTTAQGLEGGEAETDVPGLGAPPSGSPGTWGDGESLIARPPEPETETASPIGAADPADELGPYAATESEGSYPTDFEKYWKIVEDNPYDFTGWTYVLQYVEQENHLWAVRRAFDSFFTHYPYCYGYWKKYADIEKRFGFTKEAEEVYQRGLQSIPLSVDLWVHYITFLQEILDPSSPDMSAKLRSVFEMALAAAGTDFRSDRLWDSYVSWEKEQGQLKAVTAIYDRLLSIPTQLYSHHFEKFKEHVQSYSPKDILSTDEFLRLRSEVVSSLAAAEADSDDGPPGDDPPPGVGSTDQEKADTELEKIRAHLEATRHGMYLLNEEEVSKRWHFEEAIKRPYFHVKPLERVQLKNWKDYLDFEIASGTNERVLVLFERCVIACALYEDFWIKYAKYLENHSVEAVRNVFQRACMVHLPKKPTLHLLWAAFEEQQGDLQESRRILKTFQLVMPGLAMVLLRRVSLERRCGDLEQAEALLREAIEQHQGTPLASFFAVKLSRQLLKVQKNLTKARKVLQEAIDGDKDNVKLYLNLLELEFSCDVRANESNILGCFEQVLSSSLPLEIKIVFSQRRVEFLEDFGCSIRSLLHAYDDHQRFLKQNSSKKRAAENGVEEPEEKKARAEDSAAVIPAAATSPAALTSGDTSTSQAAYNYSAWYQPYGSYGYQSPWNYSQYYPHS